MKRHEHADLIIAWANGAEIEYLGKNPTYVDVWIPVKNPSWLTDVQYRVKPKAKEKKLVPFGKEDVKHLIGKIVFVNNGDDHYMITGSSKGDDTPSVLISSTWRLVDDLLEDFKFEDGSPCGKCIEE